MSELRYRVGRAGAFLALRQTARQVHENREEFPSPDDVTVLDWTGVEAVTGAFTDELVAAATGTSPGHHIRIEGATEAVRDVLTDVLQRRDLNAAWDA